MAAAGRWTLQVLLWAAVLLVLAAGAQSIVRTVTTFRTALLSVAPPPWGDAQAQRVATAFATDYLTWDSADAAARARALAPYLPAGTDPALGWDGRGRQAVLFAIPGEVERVGPGRAVVRVDARVRQYQRGGAAGWTALDPIWRHLAVPMALAGGQVMVSGAPAYLGQTAVPAYSRPADPGTDRAVTQATIADAERFFFAYAADRLGLVTAPGTMLTGLGGSVSFVGLDAWTVFAGTGDERDAAATVRWHDASGATYRQGYRLHLVRVIAHGASRWLVDRISSV